jgi:hypothetical protein
MKDRTARSDRKPNQSRLTNCGGGFLELLCAGVEKGQKPTSLASAPMSAKCQSCLLPGVQQLVILRQH